jgi:ankyrin repeat protein
MVDYDEAMNSIINGDLKHLQFLTSEHEDFPNGQDSFIQRHWITNAVDCGTFEVVQWMLTQNVSLHFRDDEGYSPLHSAIDRENSDKHRVLELLCLAGANINAHGINDWTPLHMAAARNDVESLRILLTHGADTDIRTRIDSYATPLEEAKLLGSNDAVKFLQQFT